MSSTEGSAARPQRQDVSVEGELGAAVRALFIEYPRRPPGARR